MSLNLASQTGIYNTRRDIPAPAQPIPLEFPYTYTRPADWLELPTVTTTDQTVVALCAVFDVPSNPVSFTLTSTGFSATGIIGNGTGSTTPGDVYTSTAAAFTTDVTVGQILTGTNVTAGTKITAVESAFFTASISSTTMTVTVITSGTIEIGMRLSSNPVYITGFLTGTGGTGTYTVSSIVALTSSAISATRCIVNTTQYVASTTITCASTYSIDWGDGTTDTDLRSGSVISHDYNYNDVTSYSSRGYRQAIMVVTRGTSNNLTGINFLVKTPLVVPNTGTYGTYNQPFLDLIVGSPYLTLLTIVNNGSLRAGYMEQFQLMSCASSYTNICNSLLWYLTSLLSVPVFNIPTNCTIFDNMFLGCTKLEAAPMLASTVTASASGMFNGCINLRYVPDYTIAFTSVANFFQGCTGLTTAPMLNLVSCTTTNLMFGTCPNLTYVPKYNTLNVTNMTNMFLSCPSLTNIPFMNTIKVTDMSSMFNGCIGITEVPLFNTGNVITMTSMFASTRKLQTIPKFNTSKVTAMGSMFNAATGLITIPEINMSNVTTATSMFASCSLLESIPTLVMPKVTNMTGMFQNCAQLETIPLINTSNVTTMSGTFNGCTALITIPLINTSNVIDMTSTFQACTVLKSIPLLNTIKVTNMNLTFYLCAGLKSVPTLNTSNVTNFTGTFANMNSLIEIPPIDTTKGTSMASFAIQCYSLERFATTLNTSNVTSSGSQFVQACTNLTILPALDMSKFTGTIYFAGCTNLSKINATGMKVATDASACKLTVSALETLMTNLGTPASTVSLNISNNPGAVAGVATGAFSNFTQGGVVITLTSGTTASLAIGMFCTVGTDIFSTSTTITSGTNGYLTTNNINNFEEDQVVSLNATVGNMTAWTYYKVTSVGTWGTNTFRLKNYTTGVEIQPSAGGVATLQFMNDIVSLTSNTITMRYKIFNSLSAQNLTFRRLNTRLASLKNWTVTG